MYSQDESEHIKRYDFQCKDSLAIVIKIQYDVITGVWSKGKRIAESPMCVLIWDINGF